MLCLYLAIPIFLLAITLLGFSGFSEKFGWSKDAKEMNAAFGAIFLIVVFIIMIILTTTTLYGISSQIKDQTILQKTIDLEKVYQERADNLTKQFALYLVDIYPQHERAVFDKIAPDGIDIYLVKYPDLKTSETIISLVIQIRELQDARYKQQADRAEILQQMRYRRQSPWIFHSFVPPIDESELLKITDT